MRTLYLQKRGCDFNKDSEEIKKSDVGNYRVFAVFKHKKYGWICGDFGGWRMWGEQQKHYIEKGLIKKEDKDKIFMYTDFQRETINGAYGCNIRNKHEKLREYTLQNILELVNENAEEKYDNAKIINEYAWANGFLMKEYNKNESELSEIGYRKRGGGRSNRVWLAKQRYYREHDLKQYVKLYGIWCLTKEEKEKYDKLKEVI